MNISSYQAFIIILFSLNLVFILVNLFIFIKLKTFKFVNNKKEDLNNSFNFSRTRSISNFEFFLEFIKKQNYTFNSSELDEYLNFYGFSEKTKKVYRAKFLKNFHDFLKDNYQINNPIIVNRDNHDLRKTIYSIDEKIQKYLAKSNQK